MQTNLKELSGWWEQVSVADLNGDGKMDLILGNIGENFYLHPDSANPVKLWVNDYDQNGNMDNILSRTMDGKDMPVFLKHDMEFQMPDSEKTKSKTRRICKKNHPGFVSGSILKTSIVKKFNYCPSIIAINEGNGQFTIQKLPLMVQFSSVNAIQCADVNGMDFPDLDFGWK